jgi:hypothetical protein
VAVLGSLVTSTYTSSVSDALRALPEGERSIAESGLVGAFDVAGRLGADGHRLIDVANRAFVDGLSIAAVAGAITVAVATIVASRLLPREAFGPEPIEAQVHEVHEIGEVDDLDDLTAVKV